MKSIWKGTLSFGLIALPVRLYSAVEDQAIHFHFVHAACRSRVRQKLVCEAESVEVERRDLARAYEEADGTLTLLSEDDLTSAAGSKGAGAGKFEPRTAGRALGVESAVLFAAALAAWLSGAGGEDGWADWLVLAVLGAAMGLRNAISLKTGVTDMSTTVLTLTLTGLASDLARGKHDQAGIRIYSVVLLLVGALGGTLLLSWAGLTWTIVAAAPGVAIAAIMMVCTPSPDPGVGVTDVG